jgi:hypothetical protein
MIPNSLEEKGTQSERERGAGGIVEFWVFVEVDECLAVVYCVGTTVSSNNIYFAHWFF